MSHSDKLHEARARALEAYEREATHAELQEVAAALGAVLREAADDNVIWNRLSGRSVRALPPGGMLGLRAAMDIDWPSILTELGYQPPPPVEYYAAAFVEGIGQSFSAEAADVDFVRGSLRELATTLTKLSGARDVPGSRLRYWIRRGARAAGKVAVVAGMAALGVTMAHAFAPLAATGVLASQVIPGVGITIGDYLTEFVVSTSLDQIKATLEPPLREPRDGGEPTSIDISALEHLYDVTDSELYDLWHRWDGTEPPQTTSADLVEDTKRIMERAKRALYLAWDEVLGSADHTRSVERAFDVLGNQLQSVDQLIAHPGPKPAAISRAIEACADALLAAKLAIADDLRPVDPLDELRHRVAQAQTAADDERRAREALGRSETALRQARLRQHAHRQPRFPPRAQTEREPNADHGLTALETEVNQRRAAAELATARHKRTCPRGTWARRRFQAHESGDHEPPATA